MMTAALPPWVRGPAGDRNCGGGNGDPADIGGYGPGGCQAGNGRGNAGTGGGAGGGVVAEVIDAAVGGEVVARLSFPSRIATVLPLAPMPAQVVVEVRMVKEA